jgi:hypothetical protein
MKYLCLIYTGEGGLEAIPDDIRAQLRRESLAHGEVLEQDPGFIASSALKWISEAKTLRIRGGRRSVTDGPFAETSEVLVGFIFIEAPDMDAALKVAEGVPLARYGSVEVRPERILEVD